MGIEIDCTGSRWQARSIADCYDHTVVRGPGFVPRKYSEKKTSDFIAPKKKLHTTLPSSSLNSQVGLDLGRDEASLSHESRACRGLSQAYTSFAWLAGRLMSCTPVCLTTFFKEKQTLLLH